MTVFTIVLTAAGAASLLYYLLMLLYTKRWTTTFSWFFAVFGAGNLGLAWALGFCSDFVRRAVFILYSAYWIVMLAVLVWIIGAMRAKTPEDLDWIIVLGAQVRGTKITNSLKRRLDAAAFYLSENKNTKVIVSGGQGKGEAVTEAFAMAEYLESCGISRERIYLEDKSESTRQNLEFSAEIIKEKFKTVGIATNNFHVRRALLLAERLGYQQVCGISASSNPVVLLNYMVREFFAIVQFVIKKER